jgi:hypothetical protein
MTAADTLTRETLQPRPRPEVEEGRRPAVRIFLGKLALFLGIQALVLGVFEVKLSGVDNSYNVQKRHLEPRLGEIRVAVLGSSQSAHGINPDRLGAEAFNFANVSQDLYYNETLLRKYLDRMSRVDLVLVEIPYFALEYDVAESPESWRLFFYRRYFGIPPEDGRWKHDVRNVSLLALYGGPKSLEFAVHGFRSDLAGPITERGWHPVEPSTASLAHLNDAVGRKRVAQHHAVMDPSRIPANVRHLERLFDELKGRGVRTAVLTLPSHRVYRDRIDAARYERMQAVIRDLGRRYGIAYFNYLDDRRFVDNDFLDTDHLNADGANKLSAILRDEVDRGTRERSD